MPKKDLKRLTLRLSPNHYIFDVGIEPRQRAKIAKNWLDNGARISSMEDMLLDMKGQLTEIIEMLGNLGKEEHVKPHQKNPPTQKKRKEFDPVSFGRNIEDAFS